MYYCIQIINYADSLYSLVDRCDFTLVIEKLRVESVDLILLNAVEGKTCEILYFNQLTLEWVV